MTNRTDRRPGAFFTGRDRELAELLEGFQDAVSGRGRLSLVSGEPGIGKSRLAYEFASRAADRGARVLWGRCWEAGGAPSYWPWVQALRAYIGERDPESLAGEMGSGAPDVARMLPEVREILPDLPEPPAVDPETARFRLFDSTTRFLTNAGRAQPIVLVLDDLHEADAPSLLLLRFVARELVGSRIFLLAAYRDTDVGEPLASALAELVREPVTFRLSLGGLSESDVARFVEETGGIAAAPALVAAVHGETEGNPLFVHEIVRLLVAEGRLKEGASVRLRVPDTVREVIGRRISRLSEQCVRALVPASVLGREFDLDVLERVGGWSRDELLEVLDEAAVAGVVTEVPDALGRLQFSHALIRDVLYEDLTPAQRIRLHEQVGEALEQLYEANPEPHLAELAHHFLQAAPAGEAGKAVGYARRGAEAAVGTLAYEEAVRLYRLALQALDLEREPDAEARCEILLALGEALARAGDLRAARETFRSAAALAGQLGLANVLARAALGYGGRFVWGRAGSDPHLVPLLRESLSVLPDTDSALRTRVLARLSGALRSDPSPELRASISAQAVEMARRLGDPATLAYALDARFAAIWTADTKEDRAPIADELVRVAETAGDRERTLQGYHYRFVVRMEGGEIAAADAALEVQDRLARELRQPAQLWYAVVCRAMRALFEGRFGDADRLITEAVEHGRRAQGMDPEVSFRMQTFLLRRDIGLFGDVEESIRRSIAEYPWYPMFRALLALLLLEIGHEGEARHEWDALAANDFAAFYRDTEWLFEMAVLAEVAATLGDADRSAALYEWLLPFVDHNVFSPPEAGLGSASRYLGLLATTMGRWGEADQHFEGAIMMNERMGARPWAVRTRIDQARMLIARDASGDRTRAIGLLTAAIDDTRDIGMPALEAQCVRLLRAEGVEAPTARRRVTMTFMFTDIVGSTDLLEAIGDEGWEDLRRWHDQTLRRLFSEHGGAEVDHAGDGFFVAFPDPEGAVRCSIAIQQTLTEHRRTHGFAPQLRIGLHAGEATEEEADFTGKAVHAAARIGALAEGGEILVSEETARSVESPVPTRDRREVRLKGLAVPVAVVSIDWRAAISRS